jgi:hypothetical protein
VGASFDRVERRLGGGRRLGSVPPVSRLDEAQGLLRMRGVESQVGDVGGDEMARIPRSDADAQKPSARR